MWYKMSLFDKILDAKKIISPHIYRTTLEKSVYLSKRFSANIYLKNEHCQKTGSFKIRGALNKVFNRPPSQAGRGIVCASAGNHGIGVACAGQLVNRDVTVFLPQYVDDFRLKLIEYYGGQAIKIDGDCGEAERAARAYADADNLSYISPYNDLDVIAGQGTIGLELNEDLPNIDYCFVAVGGGGLIAGISTYLKTTQTQCQMIGCLPENSCVMADSVQAGTIVPDKGLSTISDSTAGSLEAGSITLPICRENINKFMLLSEEKIKQAMRVIAENERWIVEGAAAVPVAALMQNQLSVAGKNIVIVLCGRNIAFNTYRSIMNIC